MLDTKPVPTMPFRSVTAVLLALLVVGCAEPEENYYAIDTPQGRMVWRRMLRNVR